MKKQNYTAVYNTASLKNIHYSFTATDLEHAIAFCKYKFIAKEIKLIHDDTQEVTIITNNHEN